MKREKENHGESLSVPQLERVNRACREFEKGWKQGESPEIGDYLQGVQGPERAHLLCELVILDIHYRRRQGESPSLEEYKERFPAEAMAIGSIVLPPPVAYPREIGPYRILQLLGEGGMGVVFLAEQREPLRRRVALKIIKLGMDTKEVVARFEAERQALALMNHPNIAKVHDAGITEESRPYFVMEHVPGEPITEYCDRQRLSTQERLALFTQVCDAVQHAHQKAVIHRDIKPSNILVMLQDEKPVPKVIDFGVAKATNQRLSEQTVFTELGQIIGTPAYMSPEQAELTAVDIDTRTDIYSLGVLLYELLAGNLPFDPESLRKAGYAEIQRIIREVDPPKPSTRISELGDGSQLAARNRKTEPRSLARQLRGDLDWITMKALEKDRTRRYTTASELAAEISRYLNQEPVLAGPPGVGYRVGKFVRRHRAIVSSASSILLLLVAGIAVSLTMYFRAEEARENLAISEKRLKTTVADLKTTVVERDAAIAQQKRDLASIQGLTLCAQSSMVLESDPGLALRLAFEGAQRAPGLFTHNALLAALEKSNERVRLVGSESVVQWAAFSPSGRRIVTASVESVRMWDARNGELLFTVAEQRDLRVRCVAFSPDGSRFLIPTSDRVTIRDTQDGRVHCEWESIKDDTIEAAAFTPDGLQVFVIAGGYGYLYDAATGRLRRRLATAIDQTRGPMFDLRGGKIIAKTSDPEGKKAVIWDSGTGDQVPLLECPAEIQSVALDRDGRRAVTMLFEKSVHVWDTSNGKKLSELENPEGRRLGAFGWPHENAEFSPDGSKVAAVVEGIRTASSVMVWSTESGCLLWKIDDPTWPCHLTQLSFSPDSQRLVVAGRIWDAESGMLLLTLEGQQGAFSPDGRRVISFPSLTPKIFNGHPEEGFPLLGGRDTAIQSVEFHPAGRLALVLTMKGRAYLWGIGWGHPFRELEISEATVTTAEISPDGDRALTVSSDSKVRVWDTERLEVVVELEGRFATFGPKGDRLLNVSPTGRAEIWRLGENQDGAVDLNAFDYLAPGDGAVLRDGETGIVSARFGPRGRRVLLRKDDGSAGVWDLGQGEFEEFELIPIDDEDANESEKPFRRPVGILGENVLALAAKESAATAFFGPWGRQVITVRGYLTGFFGRSSESWAARVRSWDTTTGEMVVDLASVRLDREWEFSYKKPRPETITGLLRLSPDGRWLLAISGSVVEVYDWARIRSEGEWSLAAKSGNRKRGAFLKAVSENDVPDFTLSEELFQELPSSRTEPIPEDYLHSWMSALTEPRPGGRASRMRVELSGHGDRVRDAAFSPDGKRVATASDDETARIWDARRAKELCRLLGHNGAVLSVAFSPDGALVLTRSADGTARIWDAASGAERLTLGGPDDPLLSARFAPDGRHVLTRSAGGKVLLWPLDVMAVARERVPGALTPQERQRFAIDQVKGGGRTK